MYQNQRPAGRAAARAATPSTLEHLTFAISSAIVLLALFSLLRLGLLIYNHELIGDTSTASFAEAFLNGLRFDLRVVIYLCAPLILALLSTRLMAARRWQRYWLSVAASLTIFLGIVELDFYREFHQRLNGLVFQYIQEDPATVLSMLWHGFPVVRLLLAWMALSGAAFILFAWLDRLTRRRSPGGRSNESQRSGRLLHSWPARSLALLLCLTFSVAGARGTLRQGPPLRWGDAFTTESMFANQLGLNGTLTLYAAGKSRLSAERDNIWEPSMPADKAVVVTRDLLLGPNEQLVDSDPAAVRRDYQAPADTRLPIRNVVVILMESFAGHFVGALGSQAGITPNFDRLARDGLLFRRFFSNGTHTHQGMFATMACFPNLPGFEYLMQTPEGGHQFSGLPQLLGARGYEDLYVYNGDFAWDNQSGFFSNQGMTRFIGRNDYVDPVVSDPTWGVSDQDMFDRAAAELLKQDGSKPFYALLQTLSHHTPYALPAPLPVEPVDGHGSLDQHLTAMRYSDWALGQFFEKARKAPYFKNTLFVVVGDHGFGAQEQLTEMDLYRFHVPLLLIAPGIQERFGSTEDIVGTQVDVVPTIMGRLDGTVRHQCWGRDLLSLPPGDPGFGIIKPSGGDQTVAMLSGDRIVVQPKGLEARVYRYRLGAQPRSTRLERSSMDQALLEQLSAFIQTATASLIGNTAGASGSSNSKNAGGNEEEQLPDKP